MIKLSVIDAIQGISGSCITVKLDRQLRSDDAFIVNGIRALVMGNRMENGQHVIYLKPRTRITDKEKVVVELTKDIDNTQALPHEQNQNSKK